MLPDLIQRIRCAPRRAPCPSCGRRGHRKRLLHRRVRTLAYRRVAWLEVTYAEYRSRCGCCKYFRTGPLDVPPKADYDTTVRQAVLDRLLRDRLNVEQTKAAMRRDFLVALSDGFVYDCLRWQVARLDLGAHRRLVLERDDVQYVSHFVTRQPLGWPTVECMNFIRGHNREDCHD